MIQRDDGFGYGIIRCDVEKVPCRTCKNALKGGIGKATCLAYPDVMENRKPDEVYFENKSCEHFKQGEDLLPFEIVL
ncbi:MAG: hypothetical protein FWD34_06320 [Oscillospiraceae bacterium]|nr:hypothetical protein [Oscillospiraceae bacterium]